MYKMHKKVVLQKYVPKYKKLAWKMIMDNKVFKDSRISVLSSFLKEKIIKKCTCIVYTICDIYTILYILYMSLYNTISVKFFMPSNGFSIKLYATNFTSTFIYKETHTLF